MLLHGRLGWRLGLVTVMSVAILGAGSAWAEFGLQTQDDQLTVVEDGKPVFVLHGEMVASPEGVPANYRRTAYLHPLYGLDGEVLTEDFPRDHYHHRGVFWAWPEGKAGDRKMDVWTLKDARQVFDSWVEREVRDGVVHIGMRNNWVFDDAPALPVVRETVMMVVHPVTAEGRAIDFSIQLENVSKEEFSLLGAANKGYGGFCVRPPAACKPMEFTTALGAQKEDALRVASPWADVSFACDKDGPKSGMAIFQHPANPDYPHDGWLLRHYAFLGAAWPHETTYVMPPQASVTLQYRLYLHRGDAAQGKVAEAFAAYTAAARP